MQSLPSFRVTSSSSSGGKILPARLPRVIGGGFELAGKPFRRVDEQELEEPGPRALADLAGAELALLSSGPSSSSSFDFFFTSLGLGLWRRRSSIPSNVSSSSSSSVLVVGPLQLELPAIVIGGRREAAPRTPPANHVEDRVQ